MASTGFFTPFRMTISLILRSLLRGGFIKDTAHYGRSASFDLVSWPLYLVEGLADDGIKLSRP